MMDPTVAQCYLFVCNMVIIVFVCERERELHGPRSHRVWGVILADSCAGKMTSVNKRKADSALHACITVPFPYYIKLEQWPEMEG